MRIRDLAITSSKATNAWRGHPRYFNRELSWLAFDERVLSEAANEANPLLERAKFLAIFESNLDEFLMVRVSGLIEQRDAGIADRTPDGLDAGTQVDMCFQVAASLREAASEIWLRGLHPALAEAGIVVAAREEWTAQEDVSLTEHFRTQIFPVCTPLLFDPPSAVPFVSNRSLNLAVLLHSADESRLARIKVPAVLPRLVRLADRRFALLEDVLAAHIGSFFPGVDVLGHSLFRVVRDADIELRELEAADLITAVEETLRLRRFGDAVLLEVGSDTPSEVERRLLDGLDLEESALRRTEGPLGLEFGWELAAMEAPELRYPRHIPVRFERLDSAASLFETVSQHDVLLHHPYDSFRPVETFFEAAASDPAVLGIKATLYRVGERSPIVESLMRAAEAGKQVAAMIELKARFDEGNNLQWSQALEEAGAHVTYGFRDLKVHCKLALIVRKEPGGVRQYAHIGTGNYNPATAALYTDLGLLTCDPDVCRDLGEVFNYLTGFSRQDEFRRLLIAPINLRDEIIGKIEREVAIHRTSGGGEIAIKVNALVDPELIDALYEASRAGVRVRLAVRGICCLRPGVPGLSENIEVVSVVGRFLEHSRAYCFENGGAPEALVGSSDMMRRNLDRRVEALVPLREAEHVRYVRENVVLAGFRDQVKAWRLLPDGSYEPVRVEGGWESHRELSGHPAAGLLGLGAEPSRD
ncbi:MAG: polyphosphate kinase 1 [Fimbriimonadaceae bacterium]|nr:polyphosphate kinase 1 [Fimbriimonadaceae bacterium]